jgi:putative endonuclease
MSRKQMIGRWGEKLAENFLVERGYGVLDRNWRSPFGEIDLVVRNETNIIFVEVKTRTSETFGLPEEAVDSRKQTRLISSAEAYLLVHPDLNDDWRIDVIAIQKSGNDSAAKIEWFENAVH